MRKPREPSQLSWGDSRPAGRLLCLQHRSLEHPARHPIVRRLVYCVRSLKIYVATAASACSPPPLISCCASSVLPAARRTIAHIPPAVRTARRSGSAICLPCLQYVARARLPFSPPDVCRYPRAPPSLQIRC
ncbi:uncharacterized protein BDZ99DRAFT_291839 [Mytilinidion resinicola]|uniref:Uncharacterized protein n=1 Tax=Mytilinidion resinicola TaxID=574789 RepID=A0A6A6YQZ2_9PEZI|nr:uncharacterized protein BDZ99DRAFT_291839 [Mytilinidion resinicola]KAF2810953.1 hypothetical protein BDZ99DRAFT_291839 [Mytilinidion resinicola]